MDLNYKLSKEKKLIKCIADALSNDKRLQLLEEIKKGKGESSHKELAEKIGLRSSSITFHLNYLIDAGLVSENDGKGLLGRKNKIPRLKIKKIIIEL